MITRCRFCTALMLGIGAMTLSPPPNSSAWHADLQPRSEDAVQKVTSEADRPLRVLFIGNSLTYYNNLPRMLEQLAWSSGVPQKLETRLVVFGGATLRSHWHRGQALKAIREGVWDYVVLQEQSALGAVYMVNGTRWITPDPRSFHEYARLFDGEVKRVGARTIFFLTWARKDTPPREQAGLAYAYVQIAKELQALVAPVGLAWQMARMEEPSMNLYLGDGSHPSPTGSYLAACVFHALLYDKSPFGASTTIKGNPIDDRGIVDQNKNETLVSLSYDDARSLQRIAWQTHKAMVAAGGYPAAARPPPPELPRLPTGRKPSIADLQGSWKGRIRLYSQPGTMELDLNWSGEVWKAEARISFGGKMKDVIPAIAEFAVTAAGISFVDSKGQEGGIVRYQAAFTGKSLSGIGEIIGKEPSYYAVGTLVLKRRR